MKHYYKKALALVGAALLLGCGVATAQERWQMRVGAGGDISFVDTSEGSKGKVGGYIEWRADYCTSQHFSVGSGVNLSYRNYETGTFRTSVWGGPAPENEFRTVTLQIPAVVGYRHQVGGCELSGYLGPTFSYIAHGEHMEVGCDLWGWKNIFQNPDFDFHRVYLSAEIGLGVRFAHHHCINTTYSQSLTRIEGGTSAHLRSFSLGYAYMF